MPRIVMKFGGTSMAGIERIRNVAQRVKREVEAGNEVAVVVSAMAGETDRLVQFCRDSATLHDPREFDVVVASGEQVSSGLLAIMLQSMDVAARSWLGWELPVKASQEHGKARIAAIDADVIGAAISGGEVAVIPGFQGRTAEGRLATLGRGGSDTSAVAVAAALGADRCDIYTDVAGVYTTDPRIVPRARKLGRVSYEEMLELASVGAKVLQTRSVGLAMRHNLPVMVLSSFEEADGTLIAGAEETGKARMEEEVITGIAYEKNEAKITLTGIGDAPGAMAAVFGPLAEANIAPDMIVQTGDALTFTINESELARVLDIIEESKGEIGYASLDEDRAVAKLSVVGLGMKSHTGAAATLFRTLADRGIAIQAVSTSEIRISVLIPEEATELAVRVLHTAYGLDEEAEA